MMNKSKIDWCDFSWNPVTGCRYRCAYCYAEKQARRFSGDIRTNLGSKQIEFDAPRGLYTLKEPFKNERGAVVPFPAGFAPTMHEYRLAMPARKKKPANIFVCSMADLFGELIPDEWIRLVFEACKAAPWHNYLFLTKNPTRYCKIADAGWLPDDKNFWYGSTITRKGESFFGGSIHWNTFISIEPLLEPLEVGIGSLGGTRWIIVGAETGNRAGKVKPKRAWIENIVETARITQAAVLLKDSDTMREIWGEELLQEYPPELKHPEDKAIPRCKECEHCVKEPDGKRGDRYYCETGWIEAGYDDRGARHILGRYTRTSPPWCHKRGDVDD